MWYDSRTKLKFKGSWLKQEDEATYTPKHVANLFICNQHFHYLMVA